MKRPRIVLADDHSLILAGIRSLLEPFCEVVREAGDGRSLVAASLELKPDLVILDVTMPLLNGIDAARQIKKEWPDAKLLFLSMHASPAYLREAFRAGGVGYVLKSSAAEELRVAVQRVLRGEKYVTASFDADLLETIEGYAGKTSRAEAGLTDRQREVLQLIAEGRSNKEVAAILKISVKTVEFHRERLMRKLGVRSAAELGRLAASQGLVGQ
ncbi:MAG: DNA-binding response regulator [Terriglobia bacterium]|nr:MAG: DNA-binding response regulator [Terriglobia bacterium]